MNFLLYKNKTALGGRGKWILKKELNFHTYLSDLHTEKPHMQKKEWIPDITSQLKEGYQRFFSANTPPLVLKILFPFHCIFMLLPSSVFLLQNTVCSLIQLTFFFYNYTVLLFVTVYQKKYICKPFSPFPRLSAFAPASPHSCPYPLVFLSLLWYTYTCRQACLRQASSANLTDRSDRYG
ncbi:hypothetical protein [Clostridium sp. M62/1]|uniref:hypothetical protein n=1 Tax=Clostridium sp. M62/1 TaxID=411486 RepID=UPI0018DEB9D5|nr:hypothetical protein [Clostridium sp. M62/1]